MKSLLFIVTQPPYKSFLSQEFLDTIFFAASYGLKVSVLFKGDGVKQLQQHTLDSSTVKNISKQITAFEHFDITEVFVTRANNGSFSIPVKHVEAEAELISQFDYVIYDELTCQN